jgi:hypothetical protein
MKILAVEAELYNADRQTNIMKLIVAFRNFKNTPKKPSVFPHDMFLRSTYF